MHQKSSQNPQKINPKWRKSEPWGTPKRRQEAKMKKRGGPPNSPAAFSANLDEHWSQDEGQNQPKHQ